MRIFACFSLFFTVSIGVACARESDILSPQQRMVTVDLARTLLTTKPDARPAEEIVHRNPFDPVQRAVAIQSQAPGIGTPQRMTDRDLLLSLAESVTPSGTMKLGDMQILLFGQKKIKVGDTITIVFQGTTYELQVSGIDRISYTLRLNQEEITRPIKKLVNKP